MSPGATYGLVTFLVGVMFLLGWLYATAGNPRCGAILKKSLWLFVLPVMFTPGGWIKANVGMWALVAVEEGLKVFASTRERNRINRFWLVSLFGVWELILDKPFYGVVLAQTIDSWSRAEIVGLVYSTALPVLMHLVTAAIYAFALEGRLWLAFIASWVVHLTFNESVRYFHSSVPAGFVETSILVILFVGILLNQSPRSLAESVD